MYSLIIEGKHGYPDFTCEFPLLGGVINCLRSGGKGPVKGYDCSDNPFARKGRFVSHDYYGRGYHVFYITKDRDALNKYDVQAVCDGLKDNVKPAPRVLANMLAETIARLFPDRGAYSVTPIITDDTIVLCFGGYFAIVLRKADLLITPSWLGSTFDLIQGEVRDVTECRPYVCDEGVYLQFCGWAINIGSDGWWAEDTTGG